MRRNFYKHYFVLIIYSFLFTSSMLLGSESDFNRIEKYFKNVPADIQTSIYWYWINDNLSKEAVIKDLHSMKEKGINRAFIGNIGLSPNEAPYGSVKIFTDEWWDILHTALKTATELDIEIGLFNSPESIWRALGEARTVNEISRPFRKKSNRTVQSSRVSCATFK